jgi:hypothetical protein
MAAAYSWEHIQEWMRQAQQDLYNITGIPQMSEDLDGKLPKQELLIKILKMTTSDNDATALVAIRRANEFLDRNHWDWEKLINGKIKIAADPFANLQTPQAKAEFGSASRPPPPPRPAAPPFNPRPYNPQRAQAPRPAQAPTGQPAPPPKPRQPISAKDNMYAGWCFCCGDPVAVKAGFIFDPSKHNHNARSKWQIICHHCNSASYPSIGAVAATRRRTPQNAGQAAPSLNDI